MKNYDPVEEVAKGKRNAIEVMDEFCDAGAAFKDPTLGFISLLSGDRDKGIRHILSRREREIADDGRLAGQVPRDIVLKPIEVIVLGTKTAAGRKYVIEYDGYRALLAFPEGEQLNPWLLTGYKLTKK